MSKPKLSVVVAGWKGSGEAAATAPQALRPLIEQGIAEVVLVTTRADSDSLSPEGGVRVVGCPPRTTVPRLRAAGIAAARGEIVALTEGFCSPAPGWGEALLAAHRRVEALAVGGPVDRRRGRAAEWALTFCEYGRFLRRTPAAFVDDLPGINVSYRLDRLRLVLEGLPDELTEVAVHDRIRRRGERFWRQPEALMFDDSRPTFGASLVAQAHHGRLYGGGRVEGSAAGARILRLATAPAIPAVLLWRIGGGALAAGRALQLLRALPWLVLLLAAWTSGEVLGYLRGVGDSAERWR